MDLRKTYPRLYFLWADLFKKGEKTKSALTDALRENQLFAKLSDSELAYLSSMVYERVYEKGEPVFQQNERGFGLYLILSGSVEIKALSGEKEIPVTTLGEGSFFGELALIEEDNVRSATAVPLERSSIVGFFKPDLLEILERRPSMGVKILMSLSTVLGKRLLETTERIPDVGAK